MHFCWSNCTEHERGFPGSMSPPQWRWHLMNRPMNHRPKHVHSYSNAMKLHSCASFEGLMDKGNHRASGTPQCLAHQGNPGTLRNKSLAHSNDRDDAGRGYRYPSALDSLDHWCRLIDLAMFSFNLQLFTAGSCRSRRERDSSKGETKKWRKNSWNEKLVDIWETSLRC